MSEPTRPALLDRIAGIVGERHVLVEPHDVAPFVVDWRGQYRGEALAVVRPGSTAEVAGVVRAAGEAGVALVPQGGNTGLAAGAVPSVAPAPGARQELVLSLSRVNAIRDVDPVGLTMELEAGCILKVAQDAAAAAGRLLPVSLAAEGSAQIGGVLAANAGGINVVRYGMARQLALGLEVVLADGTVVDGLRRLRKDNAGYDWKHVFIGSEGTLGIITAAVLRLAPRPRERVTSLLAVPDPQAAIALLARAQEELGDTVSAFELIGGDCLVLVERHFGLASPVAAAPWFVLLEASASIPGLRDAAEATLGGALEAGEATDGVIAESETQALAIWALREHITEAELKEGPSLKHDVSVPVSSIPAFLDEASRAVADAFPGARLNPFGHAGDGNIHFNVLLQPQHDRAALNRTVHDVVARFGGSISAEHGVGQYRVGDLSRYKGPAELSTMARLKQAFDPAGLLNPGKVIRREG
jgi:FAD/FMN-containing dehydrogenase